MTTPLTIVRAVDCDLGSAIADFLAVKAKDLFHSDPILKGFKDLRRVCGYVSVVLIGIDKTHPLYDDLICIIDIR